MIFPLTYTAMAMPCRLQKQTKVISEFRDLEFAKADADRERDKFEAEKVFAFNLQPPTARGNHRSFMPSSLSSSLYILLIILPFCLLLIARLLVRNIYYYSTSKLVPCDRFV